jgi:RNA polymerase sigma factor (sigma-70 family)
MGRATAFMERMADRVIPTVDKRACTHSGSFEAFFESEHARLQRALFVLTGNEYEAEDLMQAAFVAIWERWDRVRKMEDPTGYLFRTAMNRHRSAMRRARTVAARALGGPSTADSFAQIDEEDAVARGLAALPRRQRAALVLTELIGFDAPAAARILGVKDATVRSLASQARATLRRALEEENG